MRLLQSLLLFFFFNTSASAYVLSGNFWELGQATFHVGISGNAPSGTSWNTAFKRAMDAWSGATNFQFVAADDYQDPCIARQNNGFGDNITGIDFTADVCGDAYGTNVLAITLTAGTCLNQQCTGGFKITDADIVFRNDESWDVYSGPLRFNNTIDFQRVALHELGHALGLRHETSNTAIMQALVNDNHTLQSDDINGANAIYAGAEPIAAIIKSIYGIDIVVPAASTLFGPNDSLNLSGALANSDVSLDSKFIDLYQITFTNDSSINLQASSSGFDTFLYLVRITSTQDAIPAYTFVDDNSGTGTNSQISTNVQAGTYWVGVSSAVNNQLGSYDLALISSTANPPSSFQSFQSIYGVPVQRNPNPVIAGNLNTSDFAFNGKFLDLYQFEVLNQTNLRIELSAAAFDTVLLLTRVVPNVVLESQVLDESLLLQNDDFSAGSNSRLDQVLAPGTYWIGVTSFDLAETGDYQITTSITFP